MPHFYFNVQDGVISSDENGSEMVDFDDARRQALHMAGIMLQDQGLGHSPVSPLCIDVADGSRTVVLSIQVALIYRSASESASYETWSSHLT